LPSTSIGSPHKQLQATPASFCPQVQVHDGEVTLTGMVESRFAKHQAEDVADSVSGVRHVQNNLRVRS
jgi:osmotically-inducible protein OsmY